MEDKLKSFDIIVEESHDHTSIDQSCGGQEKSFNSNLPNW